MHRSGMIISHLSTIVALVTAGVIGIERSPSSPVFVVGDPGDSITTGVKKKRSKTSNQDETFTAVFASGFRRW